MTDDLAARIGAVGPDEVATFVIASHRDGVTSVNLLAPIVVNNLTDMCAQVILDGQGHDVKPVLAAV